MSDIKSSIRKDLLFVIIFSALVPFVCSVVLILSNYNGLKKNILLIEKSAMDTTERSFQHIQRNIEFAINNIARDQDLANYLYSPENLRGYTRNLVYGKVVNFANKDLHIDSWALIDLRKNVLMSNEWQVGKNKKSLALNEGWSKSSDNIIQYTKKIQFDDQYQDGPGAKLKAYLITRFSLIKISKTIPSLKEIIDDKHNNLKTSIKPISENRMGNFILVLSIVVVFLLSSVFYGLFLIRKKVLFPLGELTKYVNLKGNLTLNKKRGGNEIDNLKQAFVQYVEYVSDTRDQIIEATKEKVLNLQAAQVAHDIRSPLAALDMIVSDAHELPEEKRSIIRNAARRIHDIADNLLFKSKNSDDDNNQLENHMLTGLIAPLLAEKRTQYRKHIGLDIEADFTQHHYGVFVKVNAVEFRRVLSNLINNSVEAMIEAGNVQIVPIITKDYAEIQVVDNGPGISQEILPKLMKKGATFGKKSGSGLGLFHAKQSIESWGGRLELKSQKTTGTRVIITLPRSPAPRWFLDHIELTPAMNIVILDDDSSIHQVWDAKFSSLKLHEHQINILHFSNPNEIINWHQKRDQSSQYMYLFDYEILGQNLSGLDLIEKLNLQNSAILVTSHYENKKIRERCATINVPLLPKNLAIHVPISIKTSPTVDAILIDDDDLIRLVWKSKAKEKNIQLQCFSSSNEFLKQSTLISHNTKLYIDSNLGDGVKGEVFAAELHAKGFFNLYLATGYAPEKFFDLKFLKGVLGKTPPW